MRVVIYIKEELARRCFVIGGVSMRDVVRFFFFFLMYFHFFLLHLPHVYWSLTI